MSHKMHATRTMHADWDGGGDAIYLLALGAVLEQPPAMVRNRKHIMRNMNDTV